jgi:predicted NUDIX family phosphoesterase
MEFVFVIPRPNLFPESYPHGVQFFDEGKSKDAVETGTTAEAFATCVREHGFFVEREYAERTPALKQVIPYSLVVRQGDGEGPEVLCLRRTKAGGEARLHDKLSIGVGGHINPVDMQTESPGASSDSPNEGYTQRRDGSDPIAAATRREVAEEELSIEGPYTVHRVGLLNDDSNSVGAVHVGLVQVIAVNGPVAIREVDQLEGSFVSVAELRRLDATGANFETWSSLLLSELDHLVSIPANTTAHLGHNSEGEVLTACH